MTELLIKRFIKDHKNAKKKEVRTAYGKLSSIVGMLCNFVLFVGKITVGTLSGSVSITADAVNNLSDASSSIINLLGFKMASKPADPEHPYGHGRYEYLSGLSVALLILVIGVELFKGSLDKILHPTEVEFSWITVGVLLASIAVKLWLMLFNRKIGKRISSNALIATAADSRNDVVSTAAVLIALLVSHFADIELDGWIGIAVAVFILYSGFGLVKETVDPMLGKAPDREYVRMIHDKIMSYPGVLGTHDLMVHDYGPGRMFASAHVEMAAEKDTLEAHEIIDNIERDFLKDPGLHIIIHYDPISTTSTVATDLRMWLADKVKVIYPSMTVHDLRVVEGPTNCNVIFDCVVPFDIEMTDGEIKAAISALVKDTYPNYYCVITVDREYSPMPH